MTQLTDTIKSMLPQRIVPVFKRTINSIRSIYFSGSGLVCPFCHGNFRQMLPFGQTYPVLREKEVIGGGYRENCICPKCNSSDRERLVYLYLTHKTDLLHRRIAVLHIAPEINLQNIFMQNKKVTYISGDLDSPLAMMKLDITEIPFEDDSFDLIVCNHVLEHVPDDGRAMREMYRVLKPGGLAILQVPVSRITTETAEDLNPLTEEERITYFGQKDHVRIYAASDYVSRLKKSSFRVEEFNWNLYRNFDPVHNRYSLNPAERLFIARKRG